MKEFWNERFSAYEYIYGKEPNNFFRHFLDERRPGRILLPAEGEGRNAVYAAKLGWKVKAVDFSMAGKEKALELAKISGVKIDYEVTDLTDWKTEEKYNVIGLFYSHLVPEIRPIVHSKLLESLAQNGEIVMEAFNTDQLKNNSGGPKNIDMLYSSEILAKDFASLEIKYLEEIETEINEGTFHKGKADVVRMLAQKS